MSPDVSTGFADFFEERIRAADAKEVGVGNPAEETYRYPNQSFLFPTLNIGQQMSMHKGRKLFSSGNLDNGRNARTIHVHFALPGRPVINREPRL